MGADRVDPSGIPEFTGNLSALERAVSDLRGDAGKVRDTGADTHSGFQGLSAFYSAPEAEQLFASTKPVRDRADDFGDDLGRVAGALDSYASEVRPIVSRLKDLKRQATSFVGSIEGDDDWREDEGKVEENNDLVQDVSVAVAQFWAAERTAANKITSLFGGTRFVTNDGSNGKNMYGFAAGEMKKAGDTPWGKAVEPDYPWYEDVGHWAKDFLWDGVVVDGVWGTLTGLGTLVNPWSDGFGAAWKGMAQLGTAVAVMSNPLGLPGYGLMPDGAVKDWVGESLNTTKEVGKSLVAWDEWSKNPARAAGLTTFNVLTTVASFGTGAALKAGGAAGTTAKVASAASKAGRVIDPMTYVSKGVGAGLTKLPKISDVTTGLKDLTSVKAVELPDGQLQLPDGKVVAPENLPAGKSAVELPDGSVKLPDGQIMHPDGTFDNVGGDTAAHSADSPGVSSTHDTVNPSLHGSANTVDPPGTGGGHDGDGVSGVGDAQYRVTKHVSDSEWRHLLPDEQMRVADAEIKSGAVTFSDNVDAMQYGAKNWNEYVDGIPSAQKSAVFDYTMEPPHTAPTYKNMNAFLRGDGSQGTPEVLNRIEEIDKAMIGNPVREDVTVVRGTGLSHFNVPPHLMAGRTFTDDSYMSTSLGDPAGAFAGKEAVFHLRVPKGTPALWVEKVSAYGVGERELLIGRDTSYRVTRVIRHDGQWQVFGEVLPK